MRNLYVLAVFWAVHVAAVAAPTTILFVGNSYTFGRVDPVMSYNAGTVDDMTRPRPDLPDPNFTETAGTRPWEPHPWGGVPAIFKQLADQAGVEVAVSLSTRNAATLRGHFLNTANADWDLRGNIARRKWDIVVLQEQSDAPLPAGRGANANYPQFSAYADKIEKFIHIGAAENYRERAMYTAIYGSVANCVAAGGTLSSCDNNTLRTIPANPNANAAARVYLLQTWARPDMVFPHLATVADANYPTVPDGRPIVDTGNPAFPQGFPDTLYYENEGLAGMTADLRSAFANKAVANPNFAGVIPVGEAFQRAVDSGIAKADGFYTAEGVYSMLVPQDKINLWWDDYLHASKYGSYLSALVIFGKLTGINPATFGATEKAAADLGIGPGDAVRLQRVAWEQLAAEGMPLNMIPCLHANPAADGAGPGSQSAQVCGRGLGR
ncbi:MAG TPA: hypothetical protein VFN64_02980 [Burkholderiaceae bacterium]|nr:hypothetical protein [Burkholderiaceae bacterium]